MLPNLATIQSIVSCSNLRHNRCEQVVPRVPGHYRDYIKYLFRDQGRKSLFRDHNPTHVDRTCRTVEQAKRPKQKAIFLLIFNWIDGPPYSSIPKPAQPRPSLSWAALPWKTWRPPTTTRPPLLTTPTTLLHHRPPPPERRRRRRRRSSSIIRHRLFTWPLHIPITSSSPLLTALPAPSPLSSPLGTRSGPSSSPASPTT